jgi:DNA-binding GntR family transcriptional regulator
MSLPQLSSATLADQAYDAMREGIITGTLARGERVTERGLAESLNISATPVREALRRLEQDRLVERIGPRSVRVAKFDDQELREVGLIEDALQALSARLAAEKATPAQIEAMRTVLDSADVLFGEAKAATGAKSSKTLTSLVVGIHRAAREFHALVDQASGNPTLIQMLRMVDAFGHDERRLAVLSEVVVDAAAVEERYRQHRAIFEAIAARDPEQAESLMRAHSHSSNSSRLANRIE